MKHQCSFTVDSAIINRDFVLAVVENYLKRFESTNEEVSDIKTAVSEAVMNCIVHAYPDKPGKIHVELSNKNNNCIRIVIRDTGCGIADIKKALTPLYSSVGGSERSGLGFTVMEAFCNKVKVVSVVNKGTTVTLEKILK